MDRRQEFNNLPFQEKLEFLYGLPARQKLDLILSAPEAERLVQSFAPQTLFYTLKEIGVADAGDLLSLAVPEQIKWLFDLDCWDKDQPNLQRMREWIEAIAEGGRRRLADGLMELDLELVSLLLRQYLRVHRVDEPQENTDAPSNRFVQFDEHYLLEFIRHDAIQPHLLEFIEEAFERDYNYFSGLMEEIYWGVEAELEEEAYQFRNARLADHGFPDYYDAQAVFAYLNPQQFLEIRAQYIAPLRDSAPAQNGALPPELALTQSDVASSLFNTALTAGFAAQGARQLRSEMALVSNQVLVARAVDFGDAEAVREAVAMTHDYLNLGLEHLAGGDLETAIEHLRATHLKLLFRLGVSLTIDLRKRTSETIQRLGFDPQRAREIPYLDSPYREALAALIERQPRFYGGLEGAGAASARNFRAMREVHLNYAMLEQIEAAAELIEELLGIRLRSAEFRAAVAGREVRLSQILLTSLIRHAREGRAAAAALTAAELRDARAAIVTIERPGRLNEGFHQATERFMEALEPGLQRRAAAFVESCLRMLEDELGNLEAGAEIDPRYIRSVLLCGT